MQIYLAVTPNEAASALRVCPALAHIAYRIGADSTLLRQNPLPFRGGLLSISDCQSPCVTQPKRLCDAVLRECERRDYAGVLLDFEGELRDDLLQFAGELSKLLTARKRKLYLPEAYAAVRDAAVLICTALSGGSLTGRLEEAIAAYGRGRIALDVQRLRMDFTLPARTGTGEPLDGEAFQRLTAREQSTVFFSPELCARYFTYVRRAVPHLVLFDDADTIRKKLELAQTLQIGEAFLMWPEIRDLAQNG